MVVRIHARFPGHTVHLDVKKVGRIPPGADGVPTGEEATKPGPSREAGRKVGYTYIHTALDAFSRLAYTKALDDETARPPSASSAAPELLQGARYRQARASGH